MKPLEESLQFQTTKSFLKCWKLIEPADKTSQNIYIVYTSRIHMQDIFDAKIFCKHCNVEMQPSEVFKQGFRLRAIQCPQCKNKIIHPTDIHKFESFNSLKQKTYNVKLRVVGNSHAISIPKEIVDFINEMNKNMSYRMNDMVKLCLEDFGRVSLSFNNQERREKW